MDFHSFLLPLFVRDSVANENRYAVHKKNEKKEEDEQTNVMNHSVSLFHFWAVSLAFTSQKIKPTIFNIEQEQ